MTAHFEGVRNVFLDRDGVINRKAAEGKYIARWSEMEILAGVEEAIAALNRSGRRVIVVSNQRGIALGLYAGADVDATHAKLQEHLARSGAHIDAFYFCPHDEGECDCRKPGTGMFLQAFRDFPDANPANSLMIGDSLSDIEAAQALGMRSIFVEGDHATRKPGAEQAVRWANAVAGSLADALLNY
ncbi:MAG: D-glycero-alpha-D-manno-heptose-1,7-bisphosphate 7-phosphatase, partial [Acidobacteriota bacterium]